MQLESWSEKNKDYFLLWNMVWHDINQNLVKKLLAQNILFNTHSIHILSLGIDLNFDNWIKDILFPCESCPYFVQTTQQKPYKQISVNDSYNAGRSPCKK